MRWPIAARAHLGERVRSRGWCGSCCESDGEEQRGKHVDGMWSESRNGTAEGTESFELRACGDAQRCPLFFEVYIQRGPTCKLVFHENSHARRKS